MNNFLFEEIFQKLIIQFNLKLKSEKLYNFGFGEVRELIFFLPASVVNRLLQ